MDLNSQHREKKYQGEAGDPPIPRIKWPTAACKKEWIQFDEDASKVLHSTLAGDVDRKIKAMSTIIYAMGKDRFGIEEQKRESQTTKENRRVREISKLRKEQCNLTKCYKKAEAHEQETLKELRDFNREKIKTPRRAENRRKNRRERVRKRSQFTANPFGFVQKLLGDKRSGRLDCPKEDVEQHLRDTHSDPDRDKDLGDQHRLIGPAEPTMEFDMSEPKLHEVMSTLKKAKAASAPGPNGIPYRVYKNCPNLANQLWRLIKVVWRRKRLPEEWLKSDGCFIPKEEDSKELKQFRTISLLNVEGKVCLAILAKRVTTYMLENNYIDTSVQKGGVPRVPGVPGCLEHTSV